MAEQDSALAKQNSNSEMALEALVVAMITFLERHSGLNKSEVVAELRSEAHQRLGSNAAYDLANSLLTTALSKY